MYGAEVARWLFSNTTLFYSDYYAKQHFHISATGEGERTTGIRRTENHFAALFTKDDLLPFLVDIAEQTSGNRFDVPFGGPGLVRGFGPDATRLSNAETRKKMLGVAGGGTGNASDNDGHATNRSSTINAWWSDGGDGSTLVVRLEHLERKVLKKLHNGLFSFVTAFGAMLGEANSEVVVEGGRGEATSTAVHSSLASTSHLYATAPFSSNGGGGTAAAQALRPHTDPYDVVVLQ